ncbi:hypothetical protein ACFOPQ_19805 [Deinococcus antarcticus]|uniref:Uncharacterized protein n=1 Tax=Deinococcus antarcticus TaxID=1298767 RepID=A0ABV8AFI8_9DEIO
MKLNPAQIQEVVTATHGLLWRELQRGDENYKGVVLTLRQQASARQWRDTLAPYALEGFSEWHSAQNLARELAQLGGVTAQVWERIRRALPSAQTLQDLMDDPHYNDVQEQY